MLVIVALLVAVALPAQGTLLEELQNDYRQLYAKASKSVVAVSDTSFGEVGNMTAAGGLGQGSRGQSAFVIEGGYVLTEATGWAYGALSAMDPDSDTLVDALKTVKSLHIHTPGGFNYECPVVGFDLANLMIVLKLPDNADLPGLKLAESIPTTGTLVAGLGNSFDSILIDQQVSFTVGSLSDRYKMKWQDYLQRIEGHGDPYRGEMLEFEGSINPGDYGGPIINMKGEVIGFAARFFAEGRHLGTAVPVTQFKHAYDAIIADKPIPTYGEFGAVAKPNDVVTHGELGLVQGKYLVEVDEGSLAARGGLMVGDVITHIDGQPLIGYESLKPILSSEYQSREQVTESPVVGEVRNKVPHSYGMPYGAPVDFTVFRNNQYKTLRIYAGAKGNTDARAGTTSADKNSIQRGTLASSASKSVVQVVLYELDRHRYDPPPQATRMTFFDKRIGPYSGVIVSEDGEILIADEVLRRFVPEDRGGMPSKMRIVVSLENGSSYDAKVVGRNGAKDLAVLKIDAEGLTPVEFKDRDIKIGETLQVLTRSFSPYVYGSAEGVCSAETRLSGSAFQHDAHIGGNSLGGLIIDSKGQPLGIVNKMDVTTYGQASGVAYATSASTLVAAIPPLLAGEFVDRPKRKFFGISGAPAFAGEPGIKILRVTPGSGAARAKPGGLQEDDILLSIDGRMLYTLEDVKAAIEARGIGETMELVVRRGDDELNMTAVLGTTD